MNPVTARQKLRVAHALADLPLISEQFRIGALSYSKVRALTRVATAENEANLVAMAKDGTANHVDRIVRKTARLNRLRKGDPQPRAARYLDTYTDENGMCILRGQLPAEVGALVVRALAAIEEQMMAESTPTDDSAQSPRPSAPRSEGHSTDELGEELREHLEEEKPTTAGQRRADALEQMAQLVLAAADKTGRSGDGYQVVVHVEQDALANPEVGAAQLDSGELVDARTAQRLACDAPTVEVTERKGHILDVGRKKRRPNTALYRALRARDRTCCFPGCERSEHLAAHHIQHWAQGGATDSDNIAMLCRQHHFLVHEGGFGVTGHPDTGLTFVFPDGRPLPQAPKAPPVPDDSRESLAQKSRDIVPTITPLTNQCTWDGQPCDYDWAVQSLL